MNTSFLRQNFSVNHLLYCVLLSMLAYSTLTMPAFNADDIIQAQPVAQDYNTFLASGRWGYYFVYKVLFDTNPAGSFALFTGIILLAISALIAARLVGLKSSAAISVFILVSTISLYYSSYLSFDSTRVVYPLANLCAIGGLYLVLNGKRFLGILVFCVAPSLFQASVQVAATVLIGAAIFTLLTGSYKDAFRQLVVGIAGMLAGVVIYYLLTKLSPILSGIPLSGRSDISVLEALQSYERLVTVFMGHSIPSGYQMPYFNSLMKAGIWAFMILFVTGIAFFAQRRDLKIFLACIAASLALMVAPFSLALVTPTDLGPRALIAYSTAHALLVAIPLEMALSRKAMPIATVFSAACVTIVGIFLFFSAIQISSTAFDEYLSSRNDLLATNRVIARIDEVVMASEIPIKGPIPIAVRYDEAISTAPRGVPNTARSAPWSREWIFRHIDPRFVPVNEVQRQAVSPSMQGRELWPHKGSVYIQDGIVVVLM